MDRLNLSQGTDEELRDIKCATCGWVMQFPKFEGEENFRSVVVHIKDDHHTLSVECDGIIDI